MRRFDGTCIEGQGNIPALYQSGLGIDEEAAAAQRLVIGLPHRLAEGADEVEMRAGLAATHPRRGALGTRSRTRRCRPRPRRRRGPSRLGARSPSARELGGERLGRSGRWFQIVTDRIGRWLACARTRNGDERAGADHRQPARIGPRQIGRGERRGRRRAPMGEARPVDGGEGRARLTGHQEIGAEHRRQAVGAIAGKDVDDLRAEKGPAARRLGRPGRHQEVGCVPLALPDLMMVAHAA